ncbi:MAG: hypothetical protein OXC60_01465 [Litoreibacter sp.]|nr:hypothetical protein [Litoreibacter sp.]
MSKSIKAIVALAFVATIAACAQQEEEVVVVEPVVEEPVFEKF